MAAERFVGESSAAARLRRQVAMIAPTDATVLIRGETGTGKGLLARLLHAGSPRGPRAMVHVDCTAFASSLVESELFGYERGAFTGATERRPGRFERAGSGTIFLDEIGDLPPALQAKLLRVLHDREFERIGGGETVRMNARILAATNRDLERSIAQGSFRQDLYYRLEVLEIWIPPLRERLEDLEELARHGLAQLASRELPTPRISSCFYPALAVHDWPGNVRELHNFLQRAVVLCDGHPLDGALARGLLEPRCAGQRAADREAPVPGAGSGGAWITPDPADIVDALHATRWNVSRAAARLRVPRSTLRYRIARLGLSRD